MSKGNVPKVLVVGDLNDKQKGVLAKLKALEGLGKVIIEYKEGDYSSIIFDPDILK